MTDHSNTPTEVLELMLVTTQTDIRHWGQRYLEYQRQMKVASDRVANLRATAGEIEAALWSRKPLD